MANIVRFGITQGTEAMARVPTQFIVPGSVTKTPHRHSAGIRMPRRARRGVSPLVQGNMPQRGLRLYPTLRDLGL